MPSPHDDDALPIDPAPSDRAKVDLWKITLALQQRVDSGCLNGSEMIHGCRDILNAWVRGGGSSLHEAVIGFTGIESQTDHVLGGSQVAIGRDVDHVRFEPGSAAEKIEVDRIGDFFHDQFRRELHGLALFLTDS